MSFTTKLDFSNNRQVKQFIETNTSLSGGTTFGVPFSMLPSGYDKSTSAITATYTGITSTFSGNSGSTNFSWYDNRMALGFNTFSAITPSNSGTSQNSGIIFTAATTGITTDGNLVNLTYTGVSFDIIPTTFYGLGGGAYSGSLQTNSLLILSAGTIDYTGRTIWVDVSGITRTNELIVNKTPSIGYVLTCTDLEGRVNFQPVSAATVSYWSAGTNSYAIAMNNSQSTSSGLNSVSEGLLTTASGDYSHAMGYGTKATGNYSYSEGFQTTAFGGEGAHAEGGETTAIGDFSHSEGRLTTAIGAYSHAEGRLTTAIGGSSHAGGLNSTASGYTSFVHGNASNAGGTSTIVLGDGITGTQSNYTYVESLNIKSVGSSASVNQIRIAADGNLTTNTSDVRLKENIKPLKNSLEIIKKLNGVTFNWKDRKSGGDNEMIGFIAQEVEKVEPLLVFTNKVDSYKGIHIDGVIPILVEAVKELSENKITTGTTYLETQSIIAEDNNIDLNFGGNSLTAINGGIRVNHALGDESAEFIIDSNGNWVTNNNISPKGLIIPFFTPNNSNDERGVKGNISIDDEYIYVKGVNKWKRIKLEEF